MLVSPEGGSFSGVTDEALSKINRRRRVSVSVSSFLILPELLSTCNLIAVVPERVTPATDSFVVGQPPVDIPGFTKGNSEQVAHQSEMGGLGMPKSPIFSR